jgi:four helix bundle protein
MNRDEMRDRTKLFALRVIKLVSSIPKSNPTANVLGRQVLRSGTSVGANYREALRASSKKHFVSLLEIALRECDETAYWLELLVEGGIFPKEKLASLQSECEELIRILAATRRTARGDGKIPKSSIINPKS